MRHMGRRGLQPAAIICCAVLALLGLTTLAQENPLAGFTRTWRDDPVWHDGQAECALYDATRTIYGQLRTYQARIYTNQEHASPQTFTKSADNRGRHAFKHHLRLDIPTENYRYHYSLMVYVGVDDLKSLKLDLGSQEDCGVTFKQYINHAGTMRWHQFSYFPDQGHQEGQSEPPAGFAFHDALSLVLRGYPFDQPRPVELMVLPSQVSNQWTSPQAVPARITYEGQQVLDLPIGQVEAHHLRVVEQTPEGQSVHDYWFAVKGAADPAGPGLHILVQYEGPEGSSLRLRHMNRCAYWER